MGHAKGITRREFLGALGWGAGGAAFLGSQVSWARPLAGLASAGLRSDPHFFLHVLFDGAWDQSYGFDARPLEMTRAGLLQNYLGTEPSLWTGANGQATWASPAVTSALAPYKSDFSVVNGVLMSASQDDHLEVAAQALAGASKIENFMPLLAGSHTPLGTVQMGFFSSDARNATELVDLDPNGALALMEKYRSGGRPDPSSPLHRFLTARADALSQGPGSLSAAARELVAGFERSGDLVDKIQSLRLTPPSPPPPNGGPDLLPGAGDPPVDVERFSEFAFELFRRGAARCVAIRPRGLFFDTHAPESAAGHPKLMTQAAEYVATLLKKLKDTPFDSTRSFFDLTTLVVSSEFSRTMRQENAPLDKTGTDHNALCNSVWLAGKRIRGGLVIGESDFRSLTEALSPAHLRKDPRRLKFMARPFDFVTGRARTDLPAELKTEDYIGFDSVVNTLYCAYGVDVSHHRKLARSATRAPLLDALLKT